MKLIIVGCGRLGSGLANEMSDAGHDVTVLTSDATKLANLADSYRGEKLIGVEFDKQLLELADISRADGLIACTESDETNALVARIAKNHFRVPQVIARLYDQRKVTIYNALGIQVIATTAWGVTRAKNLLTFNKLDTILELGNSSVEIIRMTTPTLLAGKRIREALPINDVNLVALTRENKTFLPTSDTRLQLDDALFISTYASNTEKIRRLFSV
jgi:trk system potassium uptake protein TrkA